MYSNPVFVLKLVCKIVESNVIEVVGNTVSSYLMAKKGQTACKKATHLYQMFHLRFEFVGVPKSSVEVKCQNEGLYPL